MNGDASLVSPGAQMNSLLSFGLHFDGTHLCMNRGEEGEGTKLPTSKGAWPRA